MEVRMSPLVLVGAAVVGAIVTPTLARAQLYAEVEEWPMPALSVAGTPTAWNFGQVVSVTSSSFIAVRTLS